MNFEHNPDRAVRDVQGQIGLEGGMIPADIVTLVREVAAGNITGDEAVRFILKRDEQAGDL